MANGPYYQRGDYKFRVSEQGFSETESGTAYFFLRGVPILHIVEGVEYACERQFEREITLYLSDAAVDYAVEKLRHLGWQGDKFSELDPMSPNAVTWIGQEIDVYCKHEPGRKDKNALFESWQLPWSDKKPDGSAKPPKPKSDARVASKLDAMFGRKLKESSTKPSAPKPPPPRVNNAPMVGDEIPF